MTISRVNISQEFKKKIDNKIFSETYRIIWDLGYFNIVCFVLFDCFSLRRCIVAKLERFINDNQEG